jgi:hypothetical protein
MKRLIFLIILLLIASPAFAVHNGDHTQVCNTTLNNKLVVTWVADTGDGIVDAVVCYDVFGVISRVVTDPDGGPTDNYDVLIESDSVNLCKNTNGTDMCLNRDTSNNEEVVFMCTPENPVAASGLPLRRMVRGNVTVTISGNTDTSAGGVVIIYFENP